MSKQNDKLIKHFFIMEFFIYMYMEKQFMNQAHHRFEILIGKVLQHTHPQTGSPSLNFLKEIDHKLWWIICVCFKTYRKSVNSGISFSFDLSHKTKIILEYQHYHKQYNYLKQYFCCSLPLCNISLDSYSQITVF